MKSNIKNKELPLTGYSDKFSVSANDVISFKVSSLKNTNVKVVFKRIISSDPNPNGPGIIEEDLSKQINPMNFIAKHQPFFSGSSVISKKQLEIKFNKNFIISAYFFSTLRKKSNQSILSVGNLNIYISHKNILSCRIGNFIIEGKEIDLKKWCYVKLQFFKKTNEISLHQRSEDNFYVTKKPIFLTHKIRGKFLIACNISNGIFSDHFNGKIENPKIKILDNKYFDLIHFDFSKNISSLNIFDMSKNGNHGKLINHPTRAVTGYKWNGSEMDWKKKPSHYAAIHFHEDDIYDFNWETNFKLKIPNKFKSGIYIAKIFTKNFTDSIPFIVSANQKKTKNKLCLVLPSFTYIVYGNHARPDYSKKWKQKTKNWNGYNYNPAEFPNYGLSTYNFHNDGSGICHASHLRPLLNLRPKYITFGNTKCSGLRHIQADTHIISWLEKNKISYDIISDHTLEESKDNILNNYECVLTSSHPEYHTEKTREKFLQYSKSKGNLVYLGGNGFYWKVVLHAKEKHLIEIRRSEDGIRAWASEPGEYYHAFDGSYGGLWRRQGKAPQKIVGIGFTAQGNFNGSYYVRKNYEEKYNWIFNGVPSKKLGDFGLSGFGAAGFELDKVDFNLGSPKNIIILASSENHGKDFILVPEEQLTHITNLSGLPIKENLKSDMIYYENSNGGKLFSVGSITFCGSLPTNKFNNNISIILKNVINKFINN